ncbi:hypothetical protein SUGI_0574190 [Cryptomeria japonica]|nr:hypothetical protein SUGI_0574190 [Cryptomeria japonica]
MEGGNLGDDDLREGRLEKCKDGQADRGHEGFDVDDHGEGMAVLDFDVLCATVAMQSEHLSFEFTRLADREGGGGVQRMWEGGLMDFCDDHKILLETTCCPSSTFGKNMRRAGFGTCIVQGTAHFLSGLFALANFIAFGVTKVHTFLYVAIIITLSMAAYAGYFRTEMRRRFNIKVSDSALDDCIHHLLCSSCSLCQEARTLEINNVQDGVWHGRGDTILVGSYRDSQKSSVELQQSSVVTVSPEACCMDKSEHAWSKLSDQSEPFVGLKHDSFL